jgi:hypothetical protein
MSRRSLVLTSKIAHHTIPALRSRFWQPLCLLIALGCVATITNQAHAMLLSDPSLKDESLWAEDNSPPAVKAQNRVMEDILKVQQFFGTTIPGTMKKHKLVFSFSPRAADVTKKEYIRMPLLLRYGLKDRWEINAGLAPFCPNPFNNGAEHRWGLGEAKVGIRYDWGHWGKVFDKVTVALDGRTPLGKPPLALSDYYAHVTPSIATARPLPWKYTTLYTSFVYDYTTDAPFRDPAPPEIMPRNTFLIIPSILYKPGEFGASIEYSFRHFEEHWGNNHLGHEIKAGPIWDMPLWRSQSWGLPGKWQFEIYGRATFEEGQKTDTGVSVRVRWRTKVREVFSKKSYERKPRPN